MSNSQSVWKLSALVGAVAIAGVMACTVTTGPNTGDDDDDDTTSSSSSSGSMTSSSSSGGSSSGGEQEQCEIPFDEVEDAACISCLSTKCEASLTKCYCASGNADCKALDDDYATCYETFQEDEDALDKCLADADAGDHAAGVGDWNAFADCTVKQCAAECGITK